MTDRIEPAALTDRAELAAYWHTRLRSGDATEPEYAAFERWRRADPENARQYQRVLDIWAVARALPESELRRLGAASFTEPRRRRFGFGIRHAGMLGLACSAAVIFWLADPPGWRDVPAYQAAFRTAHDQRRQFVLPDGSVLMLNVDTVATVRFFKDRRTVRLERGEALFQVEGRAGPPFIVDVESGAVRVTGTRFNVRRENDAFGVGVLEGRVEVGAGPWWRRKTVVLGPGGAVRATPAGGLSVLGDVDVDSAVAWRDGKVVFRATPLADAVQEVNRYARQRLAIADASAAGLRVSGVFSIDDPAAFLAALPRIVPVAVQERADGVIDIQRRRKAP